jgi:hypothetical protein
LTPKEGRAFAFPVGAAFLVLAGITWWRGHPTFMIGFVSIAVPLILAGIVIPGKLGPVYRGWMGFALLLSKVTTPIFMGITYFVVLAPIGLLLRLLGKNPVERNAGKASLWVTRAEGSGRRSDLKRQF